jgi:hypothetical protein
MQVNEGSARTRATTARGLLVADEIPEHEHVVVRAGGGHGGVEASRFA